VRESEQREQFLGSFIGEQISQQEHFSTRFLQIPETQEMDETQKLFALGSPIKAGSDTSRVTLGQIIAAAPI
jgi:hypothetical protein